MTSERSTILDHIEKIEELDLDDVEPTSHVVEVENVLRDDEPRPSWPRERILEGAPDVADGGFRGPSPGSQAAGTSSSCPAPKPPSECAPASSRDRSCSTSTASAREAT